MCENIQTINLIYSLLKQKNVGIAKVNRWIDDAKSHSNDSDKWIDELRAHLQCGASEDEFGVSYTSTNEIDNLLTYDYFTLLDDDYPAELKNALKSNTPTIISCKGNTKLLSTKTVGFGGSRKSSELGLQIATDCAMQCVEAGITVVSGYADGIDMVAHRTALINGGTTIIVLPNGLNSFQIRSELRDCWDWNRVLVISEFMPSDKWTAFRAMQRNLTVIALSKSMIIVEAGEKGGSIDAGYKALKLGKALYVTDYASAPNSASGNKILLSNGARSLRKSRHTLRTNMTPVFAGLY